MSVVGFDIGNENCVIAAVKQQAIDVLLNDESNRETPAVVCFGEKQRFLGSAGAASSMMNPKSTISQVKKLIGRNFQDSEVQNELKRLPFEATEGPGGGILIRLKYLGETHTFSPVQIMAMLFSHLKDITEKNLEAPVADCVIGIPSYFTDLQRQAYLSAAKIAGLKPLRLMHDCTATALSYGIYKTDFSTSGPTYVAFLDIGHCDTQISIVLFQPGHMKILSHAFDANLGGRDFDELLFDYFAARFRETYKIDVHSNVRACIRLRAACEKLKKVLSANTEAPLNIECLMDEKDVKGFIKREDFERLASGLMERIGVPCKKALADAGLSAGKIHSVELIGSGSRIPAISKLLASQFGKEPSRTLNASECVARGCALQCAMLSPVFRVRDYEVQDSCPFSIGFLSDKGPICTQSNSILFSRGHSFPSVKILTFHRSNSFHLESFYVNPSELPPGVPHKISSFTMGPLQDSYIEKMRVKVKIQLNLHGIVTVESATLIEGQVGQNMDKTDVDSGLSSSTSVADGDDDNAPTHSKQPGVSTESLMKDKSSQRLKIPVAEQVYGGMTVAQLSEAYEMEHKLAEWDRTVEQAKDRKNALESYVYDMRNKIFDTYRSYTTEVEQEAISKSLQETQDWLYEDGDDETESTYNSRLDDLKKLLGPIEDRYKDEETRAQATTDLLRSIADCRKAVDSLPPADREQITNECDEVERWLIERTKLQESLPKDAEPALWSRDVKCKADNLNSVCKRILGNSSPSSEEGKGTDH